MLEEHKGKYVKIFVSYSFQRKTSVLLQISTLWKKNKYHIAFLCVKSKSITDYITFFQTLLKTFFLFLVAFVILKSQQHKQTGEINRQSNSPSKEGEQAFLVAYGFRWNASLRAGKMCLNGNAIVDKFALHFSNFKIIFCTSLFSPLSFNRAKTRVNIAVIFIQIRFINMAWGSALAAGPLTCKDVQLERKWDVCKSLQHFIYYSKKLPERLQLACTDAEKSCSFAELVIMRYALSVMVVMTQQQEDVPAGNHAEQHNWTAQLEGSVEYIYKRLVTATLNSWLEGRQAGTVNHSG